MTVSKIPKVLGITTVYNINHVQEMFHEQKISILVWSLKGHVTDEDWNNDAKILVLHLRNIQIQSNREQFFEIVVIF